MGGFNTDGGGGVGAVEGRGSRWEGFSWSLAPGRTVSGSVLRATRVTRIKTEAATEAKVTMMETMDIG